MLINYTKKTNNCNAARKFTVAEANIQSWRQEKKKLIDANSAQKSFIDPKHGCF
jgi:hypothetical protein